MSSEPRQPASADEELLAAEFKTVAAVRSDAERIARISEEMALGFLALGRIETAVSIFGSSLTPAHDPAYERARTVADDSMSTSPDAVISPSAVPSMWRSPSALTSISIREWRAKRSSM